MLCLSNCDMARQLRHGSTLGMNSYSHPFAADPMGRTPQNRATACAKLGETKLVAFLFA